MTGLKAPFTGRRHVAPAFIPGIGEAEHHARRRSQNPPDHRAGRRPPSLPRRRDRRRRPRRRAPVPPIRRGASFAPLLAQLDQVIAKANEAAAAVAQVTASKSPCEPISKPSSPSSKRSPKAPTRPTKPPSAYDVPGRLRSLSSLPSLMSVRLFPGHPTAQTIHTTLADLSRSAEQPSTQITTRLDDLQNAVADQSNLWNKAVSELIDAVKIGAVPIDQFLDLYSNAQIEGQRLTEYLKGLDLNTYQNHIRELIQGLHEGSIEIAEVQDYSAKPSSSSPSSSPKSSISSARAPSP